jgi:hypothetical protein
MILPLPPVPPCPSGCNCILHAGIKLYGISAKEFCALVAIPVVAVVVAMLLSFYLTEAGGTL